MTRLPFKMLLAALCVSAANSGAFASDKQAVTALAGHVFAPPPSDSGGESVAHIHLTAQDLYKPVARTPDATQGASSPTGSSGSVTNAWGAAGAGAAAVAASGPPRVYTTMAAAAAAGVKPFAKPAPVAQKPVAEHSSLFSKLPTGVKLYELVGLLCALGFAGLLYLRKRRDSGA
jgi:hypothetical protein